MARFYNDQQKNRLRNTNLGALNDVLVYSEKKMAEESSVGGKICGCKGIRFCRLCENTDRVKNLQRERCLDWKKYRIFIYCRKCDSSGHSLTSEMHSVEQLLELYNNFHDLVQGNFDSFACETVKVVENFLTEDEEARLLKSISQSAWQVSQSGRRKQDYGPKVNFKKRKIKYHTHNNQRDNTLPEYFGFLFDRMKQLKFLEDFVAVQVTNLEYCSERGSWIEFHTDDQWAWGERIVTCSLCSDAVMSFLEEENNSLIHVPLLKRSLICISGPMRHKLKHAILPGHIVGTRIAITVREKSDRLQL
ncbi:Alpha-ketoglutarate-dependent dioxygenase alkB -like protein 4 [Trichinella patagoniensis]|uniref:Alpha-ketoglutarate-dependent dioxygenase alkB-like protein 4 n=1 Tax=Trichinella patagoniensis TaxID=990121 RepID=A0A0V0ZP43_9BILA|nr:Alpha-ketoglutarate-dependent dioxygenase alkB -like protein 4 [Trichinella patagoniensis]